jgi:hypothetical protein
VQPYAKRALRVQKNRPRNQISRPLLLTTAVKVNVILIFDPNQSFHVRLAFRFFGYEIRNRRIYNVPTYRPTETSLSLQFSFEIFTIIYKMNCFIYFISITIFKPNLYVFIDSEVNFTCSFYYEHNYKFSVAEKMLCTP